VEFLKWYLKGILKAPRVLVSPWGEYMLCIIAFVLASMLLSVFVSPLWLLLTIPVGITIAAHALWRIEKNRH